MKKIISIQKMVEESGCQIMKALVWLKRHYQEVY